MNHHTEMTIPANKENNVGKITQIYNNKIHYIHYHMIIFKSNCHYFIIIYVWY